MYLQKLCMVVGRYISTNSEPSSVTVVGRYTGSDLGVSTNKSYTSGLTVGRYISTNNHMKSP